jgi:hypothetical protein
MTLARKSHGTPLTRPATAPPSLSGGSLLVSALVQFSLSADTPRLPPENHQPFWERWGLESRIADPGVPDAPVRLDLGKQERIQPRQTTAGIPTPQQGHGAGTCRWSVDWCAADAAMSSELLIALGIPIPYCW